MKRALVLLGMSPGRATELAPPFHRLDHSPHLHIFTRNPDGCLKRVV